MWSLELVRHWHVQRRLVFFVQGPVDLYVLIVLKDFATIKAVMTACITRVPIASCGCHVEPSGLDRRPESASHALGKMRKSQLTQDGLRWRNVLL